MCEKCKRSNNIISTGRGDALPGLTRARMMADQTGGGHSPAAGKISAASASSMPLAELSALTPTARGNSETFRFIIELSESPLRVRFLDESTEQTLLELEGDAVRQLMADDTEHDSAVMQKRFALMTELTRDVVRASGDATASEASPTRMSPDSVGTDKKSRRKLWDLADKLRCPVIGTCLDVSDLKRLARNGSEVDPRDMSDYEMHACFVGAATSRNAISVPTHKYLEKKHASHVRRFSRAKTEQDLEQLWTDAMEEGQVPGAMWATVTHPKCSTRLVSRIYQDVHMLSHQIGAGQRADLKRLAETRQKLAALQHDFDALQTRLRQQLVDREKRLVDTEKLLALSGSECGRLKQETARLEAQLESERQAGKHQAMARLKRDSRRQQGLIDQLTSERDRWRETCQQTQSALGLLEETHEQAMLELQALEKHLVDGAGDDCRDCASSHCSGCPNLANKLVLCLGGRSQLLHHYRQLVSRSNGRFEHYDGGLEDNRQRLETLLAAADVVLCATDCVSHDAFYRMKRFCKRRDIPYVLMPSSGLSSFARALESASEPRTEIHIRNTTQAIPLNLFHSATPMSSQGDQDN